MHCRRAQHLLFDFIDGLSNELLRAELDRHLGECPSCEKFADEMTRSLALIRRAPAATLDASFNWKVRLGIHRERNAIRNRAAQPGSWARAWNLRYAAGAGVAFAIVLAAGTILHRSGVIESGSPTALVPAPVEKRTAREVASRPVSPLTVTPNPIVSPGQLVANGGARSPLAVASPLGAIDDPSRSEAVVDSLIERQLFALPPDEQMKLLERRIHRLQSLLNSRQAAPPGR